MERVPKDDRVEVEEKGPPTSVRLPIELRRQVLAFAKSEHRSFSNAIVVLIERGIAKK